MIKTLQIISVIAAILAGFFINVFPMIYGVRSDESIDEFLKSPSVKKKFQSAAETRSKTGQSPESPLVKQADAFAKYLNPAKPTDRKVSKGARTPNISSKVNVTPKFKVFATTYCPENPNLSQALINEPGKGRYWIRQSSMVGHLLVEQVKDGLVVVKSGEETYNIEIAEETETGAPSKPFSASPSKRSQSSVKTTPSAFSRAAANVRRTRNIPQRTQRSSSSSDEEKMNEFVNDLKDLQQHSVSDKTGAKLDPEEQKKRNARIQELISKFKSTRVSNEESEKLDNMGKELKGIQEDLNSSPSEGDEDEETSQSKSSKSAVK